MLNQARKDFEYQAWLDKEAYLEMAIEERTEQNIDTGERFDPFNEQNFLEAMSWIPDQLMFEIANKLRNKEYEKSSKVIDEFVKDYWKEQSNKEAKEYWRKHENTINHHGVNLVKRIR